MSWWFECNAKTTGEQHERLGEPGREPGAVLEHVPMDMTKFWRYL